MATLQAIKYSRGKLLVLDQLRLPHEHHYDEVSTAEEAFDCIRSMRVRGRSDVDFLSFFLSFFFCSFSSFHSLLFFFFTFSFHLIPVP